jgi:hypothetical protein
MTYRNEHISPHVALSTVVSELKSALLKFEVKNPSYHTIIDSKRHHIQTLQDIADSLHYQTNDRLTSIINKSILDLKAKDKAINSIRLIVNFEPDANRQGTITINLF